MSQEAFCMTIEDTFYIRDRGVVITGKVLSGTVRQGDLVRLVGENKSPIEAIVRGIPMHGDALLLRDLTKEDVEGMTLVTTEGLSEETA